MGLTYEWRYNNSGGIDADGQNASNLSITDARKSVDGNTFICIVTDVRGQTAMAGITTALICKFMHTCILVYPCISLFIFVYLVLSFAYNCHLLIPHSNA